jgi:hypothetical protein
MRRLKIISLLILFFLSIESYCCKCKDLGTKVFLGELIDIDTTDFTYTLKIIEQFKGDFKSTIINGKYFDSCSKFPREKGKWIIYANIENDEFININQCLGSRSELNPMCIGCYEIPPPLHPNSTEKDKMEFEKRMKILKDKAKEDWNFEIEWLRNKNRK